MAMNDDADFLINHIRNSFITSDDTGMCEMIMESEDFDGQRIRPTSTEMTTNEGRIDNIDCDLSHSHDILPDMDFGTHRRRSNTAVRLEKLKKEKKTQIKIHHIRWKDVPATLDNSSGHVFEKKFIETKEFPPDRKRSSRLSTLIAEFGDASDNPFIEFSKFDGRVNTGVPSKKIDIFLTMASPRDRHYPMAVVIVSNGPKVQDLIGYVCWQYTSEGREPRLMANEKMYSLFIAEDNGEVDSDFPCLCVKEPISKFGFTKLALVEKELTEIPSPQGAAIVTVNIPNRGFTKFPVDDLDIPLQNILDRVILRRKIKSHPGISYNLEKQNQPGQPLDPDVPLSSCNTLEFCLVRQNSCRGDVCDMEPYQPSETLNSHRYQGFTVTIINKVRSNTEVQLGISGSKIDVDPLVRSSRAKMFRFKAMTIFIDTIISCEILEEKANGRTSLQLVYISNNERKNLNFESTNENAYVINQKINSILELRISSSFKDARYQKKRLSLF